jgi:hypothetical protein
VTRKRTSTRDERPSDDLVEVELEHSRWRHFIWTVAFGILCAFLFFRVGGLVGAAIGMVSAALLVRSAWTFILTYLRPAGRILVSDHQLLLPPRLHAGAELTLPLEDVKHAYVVRRAVGWATPGPLLVVETKAARFEFPRDWFASEADQRRVAHAVSRRLGHLA